jgi:hypothetical protein
MSSTNAYAVRCSGLEADLARRRAALLEFDPSDQAGVAKCAHQIRCLADELAQTRSLMATLEAAASAVAAPAAPAARASSSFCVHVGLFLLTAIMTLLVCTTPPGQTLLASMPPLWPALQTSPWFAGLHRALVRSLSGNDMPVSEQVRHLVGSVFDDPDPNLEVDVATMLPARTSGMQTPVLSVGNDLYYEFYPLNLHPEKRVFTVKRVVSTAVQQVRGRRAFVRRLCLDLHSVSYAYVCAPYVDVILRTSVYLLFFLFRVNASDCQSHVCLCNRHPSLLLLLSACGRFRWPPPLSVWLRACHVRWSQHWPILRRGIGAEGFCASRHRCGVRTDHWQTSE